MRLRISLRAKLALVSLALLALPLAGWLYVNEMERFLLQGEERALLATGAAVLLLGWGGLAALRTSRTPPAVPPAAATPRATPSAPQDTALTARTKGSPSAPITVIEIADFQCPACRLFWAETMPQLQKEYIDPAKVRFVFVNFPLVQIHHNAAAAAQLAMCAARQNRFWPIYDALFEHQSAWAGLADPSAYFFSLGAGAGLPNYLHIGLVVNQGHQTQAHQGVVIHDYDTDFLFRFHVAG